MPSRRICVLAAATLLLAASTASAATITADDAASRVDVMALARVGLFASATDAAPATYQARPIFARIGVAATLGRWGGGTVVFEGATGDARLLDVFVSLTPTESLTLRFGRFKVATSEEFLGSAAEVPFHRRASLVGLVPTRMTGVEARDARQLGDVSTDLRLGAYVPVNDGGTIDNVAWIAGRARVGFQRGLGLHVGFGQRASATPERAAGEPASDGLVDVAATVARGDWRVLVEGVAAYDAPGDETPWSTWAQVQYRGFRAGETTLAPVLGGEWTSAADDTGAVLAGIGAFWMNDQLRATLEYSREGIGTDVGAHLIALVTQASF